MSIEKDLSRIAAALETIAVKIGTVPAEHAPVTIPVTPIPSAPPAPVTPVPAPVAPAAPASTPAAPVAAAPVQVTTVTAPFTDAKGMLQYVMDAYKSLGPEKGAKIAEVLGGLGHQNINDVRADQYPALFAGVEALK
jgi:hypothetical protein